MSCDVEVVARDLAITFPGGAEIQVQYPGVGAPSGAELVNQLLAQASAATAPLTPIFNIIEAILAIKDFASTVPEVVLNPGAVVEAIEELISKVDNLAAIVPQLSVPLMILGYIDTIISGLNALIVELQAIQDLETRTATAAQLAIDISSDALTASVECSNAVITARKGNLNESIAPLNSVIELVASLGKLVGLNIPTLETLSDDSQEAIDSLTAFVSTLTTLRNSIPV
jgi:hypothetical protein